MFELRRLSKTVIMYERAFTYQLEFLKNHINEYIDDLQYCINYTDRLISISQNMLNYLYKTNIELFNLDSNNIFLKLNIKICNKLIFHWLNKESKYILILKRYNRYFHQYKKRLENIEILCNL